MSISTPLTALLGIKHPILQAPMEYDCRRAADGGGQRRGRLWDSRRRLRRQGVAWNRKPPSSNNNRRRSASLHHLEPGEAARASGYRPGRAATCDHALVWRSQSICAAASSRGRVADLPGAKRRYGAAGGWMPVPTF